MQTRTRARPPRPTLPAGACCDCGLRLNGLLSASSTPWLAHDAGSDKGDGSVHHQSLPFGYLWMKQDKGRSSQGDREDHAGLSPVCILEDYPPSRDSSHLAVRSSLASSPLGLRAAHLSASRPPPPSAEALRPASRTKSRWCKKPDSPSRRAPAAPAPAQAG